MKYTVNLQHDFGEPTVTGIFDSMHEAVICCAEFVSARRGLDKNGMRKFKVAYPWAWTPEFLSESFPRAWVETIYTEDKKGSKK